MVSNKEKNFISAVVYLHNKERFIIKFLKELSRVLESNFEKYEIICVNDNSNDNSVDQVKIFSDEVKGSLSIINMSYYQGIEFSMNAGVDLAIGDFVFEFDSVFIDYPIDSIMNAYYRSLEGYDIVSAAPSKVKK